MGAVLDDDLYTPVELALKELRRRRQDRVLVDKATEALGGDIPPYLLKHECFVLPRHIATPNHEALYVLEQSKRYGAMAIFSQDLKDKFTSVNNLKRRLAQPDIHVATENGDAFYYHRIDFIDIPASEGLPLKDVRTLDGRSLVKLHNQLFDAVEGHRFQLVDDSIWIDRNHRGNMKRHYEKFLCLFIAHGVLFEEFETGDDMAFKVNFVLPQVKKFREAFNVQPLIVKSYSFGPMLNERHALAHPQHILDRSLLR